MFPPCFPLRSDTLQPTWSPILVWNSPGMSSRENYVICPWSTALSIVEFAASPRFVKYERTQHVRGYSANCTKVSVIIVYTQKEFRKLFVIALQND